MVFHDERKITNLVTLLMQIFGGVFLALRYEEGLLHPLSQFQHLVSLEAASMHDINKQGPDFLPEGHFSN